MPRASLIPPGAVDPESHPAVGSSLRPAGACCLSRCPSVVGYGSFQAGGHADAQAAWLPFYGGQFSPGHRPACGRPGSGVQSRAPAWAAQPRSLQRTGLDPELRWRSAAFLRAGGRLRSLLGGSVCLSSLPTRTQVPYGRAPARTYLPWPTPTCSHKQRHFDSRLAPLIYVWH